LRCPQTALITLRSQISSKTVELSPFHLQTAASSPFRLHTSIPTSPTTTPLLSSQTSPPTFNHPDTPRTILELAGYEVRIPSSDDSFPSTPPPGCVVLLRYRNGKMPAPSQEINESIFVIDVLTPADDPFLCQLPPTCPSRDEGMLPLCLRRIPLSGLG
jgi:hypothetical protein